MPLQALIVLAVASVALCAVPCATDVDCNLNGICSVAGSCTCDPAWSGPTCAILNIGPSKAGDGTCDPSRNGTAVGFTTTWGGRPLQDPASLQWHLHLAEMANHCGMCAWGGVSQVAHYVSDSMTGPYTRASTVVGPWSHNPVIIAVPDSPPAYLLFHIGIGCTTEGVHSCNYTRMPTCTNGTTPVDVHAGTVPVPNPANLTRAHTHMAESLDGPWVSIPGNWTVPGCGNNPAPLFLANGSFMMACHETMSKSPSKCVSGTEIATSLTTDWRMGEYVYQCLNVTNLEYTRGNMTFTAASEDPHLYQDARGNLHLLSHNQSPCYSGPEVAGWFGADVRGCGGHYYSNDGGNSWRFQWDHAAYNGTVFYEDGVVKTYKRERPKLVQDAKGAIVGLANGIGVELVDAFQAGDDCACTLVARVAS